MWTACTMVCGCSAGDPPPVRALTSAVPSGLEMLADQERDGRVHGDTCSQGVRNGRCVAGPTPLEVPHHISHIWLLNCACRCACADLCCASGCKCPQTEREKADFMVTPAAKVCEMVVMWPG